MDQNPARLLLVILPPGERRLEFAEPMGTPDQLSRRIAELLPGTTFDAERRGTFRRGGYEIVFSFIAEHTAIAQATGIEVMVGRGEGFTALKRIVDKTGWQAMDAATIQPVDLDRSRAAGAIVLADAPIPSPAPIAAPLAPTTTRSIPVPRPAKPAPAPAAAHSSRTIVIAGAAVGIVALLGVAGWWLNLGGIRARSAPAPAGELTAGPPAYSHVPTAGKGDEARRNAAVQFGLAADEIRARFERLKDLAPAFRADEIVHQLAQFREASAKFPAKVGENGFMPPDRLSDAAFFAQLKAMPPLPTWFADAQRDGYVFEYAGEDCTWRAHMVELGTLCFGFVYSARPLDTSGAKRSYALFSADQRIHYGTGGGVPTQTDPVVDFTGDADKAAGAPTQEPAALQEGYALRDLRQVAIAERVVNTILGRGFVNPERLPENAVYLNTKIAPMLPVYFVQAARNGYTFNFAGTSQMRAPTPFGASFESFVYTAVPQEPGASKRRAFALYPDGRIFATTEHRIPGPQDAPVTAQ